jgi:hypothetical protein
MPRGWLLLISVCLLVWIPLNFAAELASTLPSLGIRGWLAVVELAAHGLAAALAVAGGWAVWTGNQDAAKLASIAVVAWTAVVIQSLFWSRLPAQTKPGDEIPLAVLHALLAALSVWYLRRRARASR